MPADEDGRPNLEDEKKFPAHISTFFPATKVVRRVEENLINCPDWTASLSFLRLLTKNVGE